MIPRELGLPYDSFRKYQPEVIEKFYSKWDDYDYFILQAPTGSGKSAVAVALSNLLNARTFIVVKTKQLEEQYRKSFDFIKVVKGRNNFPCIASKNMLRCSEGLCLINEDFNCFYHCLYKEQKYSAINSRIACFNYVYYLSEMNFIGEFTNHGKNIADLNVFDEAHELESEITKFVSVEINKKKYKLPPFEDVDVPQWIDSSYEKFSRAYYEFKDYLSTLDIENIPRKLITEFNRIETIFRKLEFLRRVYDENWVCFTQDDKIIFKPIWGRKFNYLLFKHAKKHLMMSATILDKERFCNLLGLNKNEVYMLDVPSTFPSKNRPIYVFNAVDLSHEKIDSELPKLVRIVDKIISSYLNKKGLIHTVNYKIASYLKQNSAFKDIMIVHESEDRNEKLEEFLTSSPPRILVSPSMHEGVDLPYDKCDYIIQAKAPYADLEDKVVAERLKQDRKWYEYSALIALVQGSGRGFRAEDDKCDVIWLDRWCYVLWKNNRDKIPDYFNESVKYVGKV